MPPPDKPGTRRTISDLLAVMAALRTPGSGCPWDLEQNFASIAPYTIEEAYEVADAIERVPHRVSADIGKRIFCARQPES